VAVDELTDSDPAKAAKVTKVNATNLPASKSSLLADANSIKVSDHVVFYDKCRNLVRGIVKSIGITDVEIETVSNII